MGKIKHKKKRRIRAQEREGEASTTAAEGGLVSPEHAATVATNHDAKWR